MTMIFDGIFYYPKIYRVLGVLKTMLLALSPGFVSILRRCPARGDEANKEVGEVQFRSGGLPTVPQNCSTFKNSSFGMWMLAANQCL